MSIFPKRTLQNKDVTIHWSVALESPHNCPLFPFMRLGVKSPSGEIVYLFQKHIMLLPGDYGKDIEKIEDKKETESEKYNLNRNIPILILADYLSGKRKKEQLVEILKRIKSARHFYFTYPIADDALLGRYELVSELYLEGQYHKSLTADEDFFYVEKILVERISDSSFNLTNPSPEDCAVKIVDYKADGVYAELYTVPAMGNLIVHAKSNVCYMLYNEEREGIPLKSSEIGKKILRNQTLQNFEKQEEGRLKLYVMFPDDDNAFILEEAYVKIWQLADGTVGDKELRVIDEEAYTAMLNANLLYEI